MILMVIIKVSPYEPNNNYDITVILYKFRFNNNLLMKFCQERNYVIILQITEIHIIMKKG